LPFTKVFKGHLLYFFGFLMKLRFLLIDFLDLIFDFIQVTFLDSELLVAFLVTIFG